MTNARKTAENRLRRMARRRGFLLRKSARRDPLATDYGLYYLTLPNTTRVEAYDDLYEVERAMRSAAMLAEE